MSSKLEKFVKDGKGALRLAKLDLEKYPQMAQQLQVQNVPTLLGVHQGQLVKKVVGIVNDTAIVEFVESLLKLGGFESVQITVTKANAFLDEGNIPEASKLFNQLYTNKNLKQEAIALAGLARCAIAEKKLDIATSLISTLKKKFPRELTNKDIVKAIGIVELASVDSGKSEEELLKKVNENPDDLEAKYELGVKYAGLGRHEESINQMLEIIKRDKTWKEQAARTFIMKIFDSLGADNEISKKGRRRLAGVWFS